jgi:hypothetical protein
MAWYVVTSQYYIELRTMFGVYHIYTVLTSNLDLVLGH